MLWSTCYNIFPAADYWLLPATVHPEIKKKNQQEKS